MLFEPGARLQLSSRESWSGARGGAGASGSPARAAVSARAARRARLLARSPARPCCVLHPYRALDSTRHTRRDETPTLRAGRPPRPRSDTAATATDAGVLFTRPMWSQRRHAAHGTTKV